MQAPQDKFPATHYILNCVGVSQKQGLDMSWNNARNAQTKNIKFLIYKFHRTQLQRSPTQQSSLVICHSNSYSNTNHNWKIRQVFLRTEVWTLLSFTVYPQPSLLLWLLVRGILVGSVGRRAPRVAMAHVRCVSSRAVWPRDNPSPCQEPPPRSILGLVPALWLYSAFCLTEILSVKTEM